MNAMSKGPTVPRAHQPPGGQPAGGPADDAGGVRLTMDFDDTDDTASDPAAHSMDASQPLTGEDGPYDRSAEGAGAARARGTVSTPGAQDRGGAGAGVWDDAAAHARHAGDPADGRAGARGGAGNMDADNMGAYDGPAFAAAGEGGARRADSRAESRPGQRAAAVSNPPPGAGVGSRGATDGGMLGGAGGGTDGGMWGRAGHGASDMGHRSAGVPMRLAGIEVTLTVQLGRRQVALRDLLSSAPGQLFALDQLTDEPVDILVNGQLFARGEVVSIGDQFGVRLVALVDPEG